MFTDELDNYNMLLGAYKKIKSYYHYNKNYIFMREKIASFEYDSIEMEARINLLAKVLKSPSKYSKEIEKWIDSINYYVLPKTFSENRSIDDRFVTSSLASKSVKKVNFFIDMPIELHLLETVWTLLIAKMASDNNIFKNCSYGNAIDERGIFDENEADLKKSIRFYKNKLFKIYFPQYCAWKNNAIEAIEDNKRDKNTVLISLDIKNFYYSVRWKFDLLSKIIPDKRLDDVRSLTRIVKQTYEKYTAKISTVRILKQKIENKENVLPIGMFSSMLLANLYLSKYDEYIQKNLNVLYYGRYVDDILLLLNVNKTGFDSDDKGLERLLVSDNSILSNIDSNNFCLYDYKDLIIQREKLKVIYLEWGKSEGIISKLKKTKLVPSQMNIVPRDDVKMEDFEEAAYALHNFSTETKIRDFGQLEIDRFKLASHMAGLVRNSRHRTSIPEELKKRQLEKEKVLKFFCGSNAIEYSSNWINALYYILLSSGDKRHEWNCLEDNVRKAIKDLTIDHLEDVNTRRISGIKSKMKKDLEHLFDVCISTALAINPKFSRKEKKEILDTCYKIRNANLFNHYLVSYPLLNYSDKIGRDIDYTNLTLSKLKKEYFEIHKGRKMELSPRFVNFDELFQYSFIRSIIYGTNELVTEKVINSVRNTFLKVNNINAAWAKPLAINIQSDKRRMSGYELKKITLCGKERNLNKIRIAVANIKMDIDSCCMGLRDRPVVRNRLDFVSFLSAAYNEGEDKVDYLVFPEFYLPLAWMQDVLSFSKRTGITIISGIQYICKSDVARNVVGVFTQIKSGKYNSAGVFIREKNNYAPLEKKILATEGYTVRDRQNPVYTYFDDGTLRFGLFLCYEFTDICARGLFKGKSDVIFIPENNSDTTYFSNIIETMTRDIHAFMVQSNTSNYGDSRISGPFSRDQRNVVQIKGGDNDSLIIGTIDVQKLLDYRVEEQKKMEEEVSEILEMDEVGRKEKREKLKEEHELKIAKTSARTFW